MTEIFSLHSQAEWLLILLASFIIGLTKAGLKGVDMLSVTLMAIVFGSKASTGIVLPLLCLADIAAVAYYNRHAEWKHFKKLTPWMLVGIVFGVYFGQDMDEAIFRKIMAIIILLTIVIALVMEYRKSQEVPSFTTMIGNLAGAFSNLYFLAMRVDKNSFIGTAAWIFLIINLVKFPLQVFFWKNITIQSLKIDALLVPTLAIGFVAGIFIVGKIRDEQYRKVVLILTLVGSILMLLRR